MAFNNRVLVKIEASCKRERAMLDYMRDIISFEFGVSKQYSKFYEAALRKYSKRAEVKS